MDRSTCGLYERLDRAGVDKKLPVKYTQYFPPAHEGREII